jgi:hypothetical protein
MGESAVIIDLGELRPAGGDDDLLQMPSERVRRRWWRTATATLAGLLCLALTAAGPAPSAFTDGYRIPLTRAWYIYDEDMLYLVSGPQEVTGYRLADGHELWRATVPQQVSYLNLRSGPIAIDERGDCSMLTRLDPATGAISWTRTGIIVGDRPTGGTVWILHDTAGGCAGDAGGGSPSSEGVIEPGGLPQAIDVLDAETGVVRLSVPIKAGDEWTTGPDSTSLAVWDQRGHLVETDLTTGATLASGTIPTLANAKGTLANMMPFVLGFPDAWVVLDPPSLMVNDSQAVLTSYDRRTFAPQWSAQVPALPVDTRQFYGLWPCERTVICVQVGDSLQITLDAATGQRVPGPAAEFAPHVGRHWTVVSDPSPHSGDPPVLLWDTLAHRDAFPSWHVQTFLQADTGRVVLSRPIGEDTEFAIFDGNIGRLRRLGVTGGSYSGCELTPRQLLCLDGHLVLHVWSVPG